MLEENGPETEGAPERLRSLDVLRGFDMFWIIGGKAVILALAAVFSVNLSEWLGHRLHHPEWDGFEPYDLIFPLFLFIAGVSTVYSIDNRLAKGGSRASLHRHFVQRGLMLVLLGVLYNGLLSRDLASAEGWGEMRYASVLGRIGLAYMFAALIAANSQWRAQLIWVVGLLVGYWAALRFIPVPEFGAGDLTPGHTLTDYIDRQLVPGRLHKGDRDPEGLFAVIPAIATALGLSGLPTSTDSLICSRFAGSDRAFANSSTPHSAVRPCGPKNWAESSKGNKTSHVSIQ